MSNLEHLIENGLCWLDKTRNCNEWYEKMYEDPNWAPFVGITIEDLWTICQYIQYTWILELYDEIDELREKIYNEQSI